MGLRSYAGTTGLLGGAAWVLHYFAVRDALWWAGLALLGLACMAAGAGLVNSSATALRMFVAVAFPALVGSVWWVVRDGTSDTDVLDAVCGAAAVLASLVALSSRRGMAAHVA